ncbi:hypothetical protein [Neorhodopirellula lusitana]|uniref:hypothetical protein n=1 Tax=Neorhodopirellula lusitana TaxID=445327 RepID=UPI00384A87B9
MRNCMAIDFAKALAKAILWGPPAGEVEPYRCLGLCAAVSLVPVSSFPSLCPGRCVLAAVFRPLYKRMGWLRIAVFGSFVSIDVSMMFSSFRVG